MNLWHRAVGAVGGLFIAAAAWASESATVYPSGNRVPENLLRIELRWPGPLRTPVDMAHVRLLDGAGQVIPEAFLDLPLPSADGRRLSLLLHPARVKSGVGANLMFGRALRAGTSVTLVIDDPAIGPEVRKSWQVTGVAEDRPMPATWTFNQPVAGTRQPLIVRLQSPISASSEGLIAVKRSEGRRMPGRAQLTDGETTWHFTPTRPWQAGAHVLVTHPDLESPAGHRTCALFEQLAASRIDCEAGLEVAFTVRRH